MWYTPFSPLPIPLVHRVDPQVARAASPGRASDVRRSAPVWSSSCGTLRSCARRWSTCAGCRDGRWRGQPLEAPIVVLLVLPTHHRPGSVPAQVTEGGVDLCQQADVGLRVHAPEPLPQTLAATVPYRPGLPVLPDQPRRSGLREARRLRPESRVPRPCRASSALGYRKRTSVRLTNAYVDSRSCRVISSPTPPETNRAMGESLETVEMKRHEHPPMIPECRPTCSLLAGLTAPVHAHFSLDKTRA